MQSRLELKAGDGRIIAVARKPSLAFARIRAEVLSAVEEVPRGRVTTYGAIASHLDVSARHVAYVLAGLDSEQSQTVSWHRVVAEGGAIRLSNADERRRQASRLRAEGVGVGRDAMVKAFDTVVFRWPVRRDRPGQSVRGPYSDPATRPLFSRSIHYGYPMR